PRSRRRRLTGEPLEVAADLGFAPCALLVEPDRVTLVVERGETAPGAFLELLERLGELAAVALRALVVAADRLLARGARVGRELGAVSLQVAAVLFERGDQLAQPEEIALAFAVRGRDPRARIGHD